MSALPMREIVFLVVLQGLYMMIIGLTAMLLKDVGQSYCYRLARSHLCTEDKQPYITEYSTPCL